MEDLMNELEPSIFGSEEDTLKWFDEYLLHSDEALSTSIELFKKYYQSCLYDLVHLNFDENGEKIEYAFLSGDDKESSLEYECNYISEQDMIQCRNNQYHIHIISTLRENEYLRNTCLKEGLLGYRTMDKIMGIPEERLDGLSSEELYCIFGDDNFLSYDDAKKNEILSHMKLTKEQENSIMFPLLKVHRLNNLQIKYAHTARVVYLTDYELQHYHIDSPFIRTIALTSALFHDVGRFYQGTFYNHFNDASMKAMEGNGKGHAEAGYYYSLLNMICLNTLGVDSSLDLMTHAIASLVVKRHQLPNSKNKEFDMTQTDFQFPEDIEKKVMDFVINSYIDANLFEGGLHSRFGTVIPHQQKYMKSAISNILDTILKVEQQYISNEEQLQSVLSSIEEFLGGEYLTFLNDEEVGRREFYNEQELDDLYAIFGEEGFKSLIVNNLIPVSKELNVKICEYRTAKKNSSIFFLSDDEIEILNAIGVPDDLPIFRKKSRFADHDMIVRTPELNEYLNRYRRFQFCTQENLDFDHYGKLLEHASKDLAKYAQFDIVDSIQRQFESKNVDPDVEKLISFCLNLVMDADKLDIFVQRVNKRWDNWNPPDLKVFSDKNSGQSFVDVIENVYGIPIERNEAGEIVLTPLLKNILLHNERCNSVFDRKMKKIIDLTKDEHNEFELKLLDQFLNTDFYYSMITSKFRTNDNGDALFTLPIIKLILDKMVKNIDFRDGVFQYYSSFTKDLEGEIIPQEFMNFLIESRIELQNVTSNYISVPYSTMLEVYPNEQERVQKEMDLILPKDLREKVFLLDKERGEDDNKFPLGQRASKDPNFHWNNIFPAIWWHIDQFIMTNMRMSGSYQFISDTQLLDRLKETYSSFECPPEFAQFIDEIIEYAKVFVDIAKEKNVVQTDYQSMIEIRDEASKKWNLSKLADKIFPINPPMGNQNTDAGSHK